MSKFITSITLYQIVLHATSSIVTYFSTFKTLYAYIFHTLLCHMSKHATSITLNFKNGKFVTCRYFFNLLHHLAVRYFMAIGIIFQIVAIEFLGEFFFFSVLFNFFFLVPINFFFSVLFIL